MTQKENPSLVQSLDTNRKEDDESANERDKQFQNKDKDEGKCSIDVDQENITKYELKHPIYSSDDDMKVLKLD